MKRAIVKTIFVAALLVSIGTACAQNAGFYVKGEVGGNITQDIDVKEFLGADVSGVKLKLSPGIRGSIGGGYQFNPYVALEGEIGFMENNVDSVTGASHVHDATFGNVPFLVNGKLQYPMGRCPVTPYIGAGVGGSATYFDVDHLEINGVSIHGSDSTAVFAWQAFAGLRYALNERMGLSLEYHYFEAESASWHADVFFPTASDTFKLGPTHTHAISLAFDFRF